MDASTTSTLDRFAARMEARAWMAWTLSGVLLSCLAAFVLAPVRALAAE